MTVIFFSPPSQQAQGSVNVFQQQFEALFAQLRANIEQFDKWVFLLREKEKKERKKKNQPTKQTNKHQ